MDLYDQTQGSWEERLEYILETMRELSLQTDPEELIKTYSRRAGGTAHARRVISLSRRGVCAPRVLLARDSTWESQPNVWNERDKLPVYDRGFLSAVAYAGQVTIEQDLKLPQDDPAAPLFEGYRSVVCIPIFDKGEAMNTLILANPEPDQIKYEVLPTLVWLVNLFARGTHQLVTARKLEEALARLHSEASLIGEIQRGLLPARLPDIPNVEWAVHYEPAEQAGGDYYDFFQLASGRWGMLVADVTGHGSPAAVVMAITRTLAQIVGTGDVTPRAILTFMNQHLCTRRNVPDGSFVTAFCAVYDPASLELTYTLAGHPAPRVRRCGTSETFALESARALPLGIMANQIYREASFQLAPGDQFIAYTDGVTEASNDARDLFGVARLDRVLSKCGEEPQAIVDRLLAHMREHTGGRPLEDDVTILAMRIVK